MTKAELESKHLSELHALAAEAGLPRYRMLRREELVEKLAGGGNGGDGERKAEPRERQEPRKRQRKRRGRDGERGERRDRPERERAERRERPARRERPERQERPKPEPKAEAAEAAPAPQREERDEPPAGEARQPRRRRRRRFGRKRKELRLHDLLTPGAPGRQTIVYAETREACTTLLRELAAELGGGESNGPDPIALLVDPGPEELAEWRREAPQAEIVAAAQPRHAEDALAQAVRRAGSGEDVIVLVDSLTRLVELGDADDAKSLLDAATSVTVIAALERPA